MSAKSNADQHISSGVAEIKSVACTSKGIQVSLTDAGAREGKLFFHSTKPLKLSKTSGLEASPVEPAGENVWSIEVRNRQSRSPQSIDLTHP